MGTIVQASCSCGYKDEFFIGEGFDAKITSQEDHNLFKKEIHLLVMENKNFSRNWFPYYFPAYCKDGNHIVRIAKNETEFACPDGHKSEPIFYTTKSSLKGENCAYPQIVDQDGDFCLTNGYYFCPKCHNFTLKFEDFGCWD